MAVWCIALGVMAATNIDGITRGFVQSGVDES